MVLLKAIEARLDGGEMGAVRRRCRVRSRRKVDDGGGRDGGDASGQRIHIALAVGMDAIAEEDEEQVEPWVDPKHGAGKTTMPKCLFGKELRPIRRVATSFVPSEAAQLAGYLVGAGHFFHRGGPEDSGASKTAPIEHHLRVDGKVGNGRKQTGVSGDPTKLRCAGIVDFALHPMAIALLRGRGTLPQRIRWQVAGFLHSQRLEQMLLREFVHILAADLANDLGQNDVIHVRVDESCARIGRRGQRANVVDRPLGSFVILVQGVVRDQTAVVGQQLFDRDFLLASNSEGRQIIGRTVGKPQPTLFHQDHDAGGGGNWLGQRGEVENGIRRHRFGFWLQTLLAVRLEVRQFAMPPNRDHAARHASFFQPLLHQGIDPRKLLGIHPDLVGSHLIQA